MTYPIFHIVDRFDVPWSGSALEALAISDLLKSHVSVRLWSPEPPHDCYAPHPVATINEAAGHHPCDGTLLLVGGYYELGGWLLKAHPRSIVVKYNSFSHKQFFAWLTDLRDAGLPIPRLVFPSRRLQQAVAMDGFVEPSPIDIQRFHPSPTVSSSRFSIGRMSRDELYKHHEDDISLYKMLALAGCQIRVMGGGCLEEYLTSDRENIELIPTGAEPTEEFLRGLNCFFYRTGVFEETFGRVVLEAMATGLPVVCHRRGGYSEWIRNGENGFLFVTQEEAWEQIAALRTDRALAARIGRAARKTVESLYGETTKADRLRWYLGG